FHLVVCVGGGDDVNGSAEALWDLERRRNRQIFLARAQRRAVGMAGHQDVVRCDLVVERQIDAIGPVRRGRRNRALVDDGEFHRSGSAGVDYGTGKRADLQIRTRQNADQDRDVVYGTVVVFVGVLVHLLGGVGDDDHLVAVLDLGRQEDLLAPRIFAAGLERPVVGVAPDLNASAGLAHLAQVDA